MMVIQQPSYPKYVGPSMSPRHSVHSNDGTVSPPLATAAAAATTVTATTAAVITSTPPPPAPPPMPPQNASNAVRVIKENENVRHLIDYTVERKRSDTESPVGQQSPIAYRRRSPTPEPVHLRAYEPIKLLKRSHSIDIDDAMYDEDSDGEQRPLDGRRDATNAAVYDSDNERDHDGIVDDELPHDNDAPLDLSVAATRRRRDRTYSGTDSDDSAGVGDEKAGGGKAAYKKSLMKRYCKFFFLRLISADVIFFDGRDACFFLINYVHDK